MQGKCYTVTQAAAAVGCNPRTIRRHLAAEGLPGAHQQHTAHGPAWRIPAEALDKLRSHLALDVAPGAVEVERVPVEAPDHSQQPGAGQGVGQLDQASQLAPALVALRVALESQAAAVTAQARALDQAHQLADQAQQDALWWRCEALEARQQLDQVRAQLAAGQVEAAQLRQQFAAVEVEAAQLRALVERHQRPTLPLAQLRAQLAGVEGGAA